MLELDSLVRAHATPVCSIHEYTEKLATDLITKFPAASMITVSLKPYIKKEDRFPKLVAAKCSFSKYNIRAKSSTVQQDNNYSIKTEWHLHIPRMSEGLISLTLVTTEHTGPAAYDQLSGLEPLSPPPSLNNVHPTFAIHEQMARCVEQQSDRVESAALLLAQGLFQLADKQYPCKRLQNVHVKIENTTSRLGPFETKRGLTFRRPIMQLNKDPTTFCSIQLGRQQYEQSQQSLQGSDVPSGRHRAYLALGSNVGNRIEMIESAVREMSNRGLPVIRTSALYETKPMYLEDQEAFINGACEVCSIDAIHAQK